MLQAENVKLEKGMYNESGRSFTQVLEGCDPSERYKGTAMEGLDAYQRQLKRFDIKAKGLGSDTVEKFFATSESAVLFPEYIARNVRQGMEESDLLPHITAAVTRFDGMDYRSITSIPDESKELRHIAEGASIPQTAVKTQENLVKLHKRGRMLVASYEAIRYQKLDLFSVTLRQIGAHISRMHLEDAVDVILKGDGNGNPAQSFDVATKGTLVYADLVDFWSKFDPYELNTMLVSGNTMTKLLKMAEFQNPATGLNFQGTGKLETPLGAKLLRTNAVPDGKIIGLDKRYALEMVKGSDVMVEYDKLIDRQLERAAITSISGFAKLFNEAGKVLAI
ncbi:MAG: phage major capsid protein [Oscillospiraceae bacterium]